MILIGDIEPEDADDVLHYLKQIVALVQLGAEAKSLNEEMNVWSQMIPFLGGAQGVIARIEDKQTLKQALNKELPGKQEK